jgi:uncharacterized membrane protein YdjX (TVP38/TMEM64 family)
MNSRATTTADSLEHEGSIDRPTAQRQGSRDDRTLLDRRWMAVWNRVCAGLIVLALLALAWFLPLREWTFDLRHRAVGGGAWGALGFIGTFVLVSLACLPTWPLPIAAGALFGTVRGGLLASAACVTAAAAGFLAARGLGRTSMRRWLESSPRLRALEHTVAEAGWKVVAAVRVSHFLPFGMQNYAFGLTRIRLRTFLAMTWGVTFPGIMFQAYLGHVGFTSVEAWHERSAADWQTWGLRIGAGLLLAGAVIYIGRLGRTVYRTAIRRELERELEAERGSQGRSTRRPWLSVALGIAAATLWAAALAAWSRA